VFGAIALIYSTSANDINSINTPDLGQNFDAQIGNFVPFSNDDGNQIYNQNADPSLNAGQIVNGAEEGPKDEEEGNGELSGRFWGGL
jgi:hypothetical protein